MNKRHQKAAFYRELWLRCFQDLQRFLKLQNGVVAPQAPPPCLMTPPGTLQPMCHLWWFPSSEKWAMTHPKVKPSSLRPVKHRLVWDSLIRDPWDQDLFDAFCSPDPGLVSHLFPNGVEDINPSGNAQNFPSDCLVNRISQWKWSAIIPNVLASRSPYNIYIIVNQQGVRALLKWFDGRCSLSTVIPKIEKHLQLTAVERFLEPTGFDHTMICREESIQWTDSPMAEHHKEGFRLHYLWEKTSHLEGRRKIMTPIQRTPGSLCSSLGNKHGFTWIPRQFHIPIISPFSIPKHPSVLILCRPIS